MAEIQLFYIGTSKIKEIRQGGSVTYVWGKTSGWNTFAKPGSSKKQIAYKSSYKNGDDSDKNATGWRTGGVTIYGTSIPATATRIVDGVERVCSVRFRMKRSFRYTRTKKQKRKKKCTKTTLTYNKYQLQYADKAVVEKSYSTYENGIDYIFFGDHYYDASGNRVETTGHLLHPIECPITYSDVRRNFNSEANNSDNRDNSGSYVLSNVRSNVVSISLKWAGLSAEDGRDLIDSLNPDKDHPYLTVQYRDPATGKPKNGTFYTSERAVSKYANGIFKEITVTLTEV